MTITLTEQIDEAFQNGGLSFQDARQICDLWKERDELDQFMSMQGAGNPDKQSSDKLRTLTDKIETILEKAKLTASERLGLAEEKLKI